MQVHNYLSHFIDCIHRWKHLPSHSQFEEEYLQPLSGHLDALMEDFLDYGRPSFYSLLKDLQWDLYRKDALLLRPDKEQERVQRELSRLEALFETPLQGDVVLFGAFTLMDGYARFDRGTHCVYLGVDESHQQGRYLDILEAHELTHVVRESRRSTWEGWGLDPSMSHDEFVQCQPVLEHLFGEGLSCAVSEALHPESPPWHYCYQTRHSLESAWKHGPAIDRAIHHALSNVRSNYRDLYDPALYAPLQAPYIHYVWAWEWVKALARDFGHNRPVELVHHCSKDFIEHALKFRLPSQPTPPLRNEMT